MARPAYKITFDDFRHTTAYLSSRIREFELEFRDLDVMETAKDEYLKISRSRPSNAAAERLQAWCDEYLSEEEWERTKSSIRKRRQRWAPPQPLKTITITQKAHRLLRELAKRDDVTLSAAIERYMPAVLNQPSRTFTRNTSK